MPRGPTPFQLGAPGMRVAANGGRVGLEQQPLPRSLEKCPDRGRLLISCPDRPGVVATVSRFLLDRGANLVHLDQHTANPDGGHFSMRVEFDLPDLERMTPELRKDFTAVAEPFGMEWRLVYTCRRKRVAIFASREEHCLEELLWRWEAGDLRADIVMVVSNHPDLEAVVAGRDIPFYYVPVMPNRKQEAEQAQLALLEGRADLVVLARYMQILSGDFVRHWPNRIINIHPSFLPAFPGPQAYEQAYRRGVKLIGATAHYVAEELDAGPIIDQEVQRVCHRCSVQDLKCLGRYVERTVLARAVSWHIEDQVVVKGNRTMVLA